MRIVSGFNAIKNTVHHILYIDNLQEEKMREQVFIFSWDAVVTGGDL